MVFEKLASEITTIKEITVPQERKDILQSLIDYVQEKVTKNETASLVFICTHNSRRSHLAQIWAQTVAYHFGLLNVTTFSSGTEATAVYPTVIETLKNTGFEVETLAETTNSIYSIKYTQNEHPIIGFSKTLYDAFNPKTKFAAIMTCSQADEGCPFIAGAEKRVPITYEDPKIADNTPLELEKYQERSLQIASEMYYVFNQIKNNQ